MAFCIDNNINCLSSKCFVSKVISYTWSDDYSECTAKAVCQNDNEHVIEETKSSNLNKYDVNGVIKFTYTASFNNKDIFQDAEFVALILTPINNNAAYSVKAGDKSLKGDIEIPSEYGGKPVTAIDNNGFKECKSLKSVVIPESITSIGDWAFGSCSNLVSTNLPSGLTGLGSYAFYDCSKLSSDIVIPAGITSISWRAFDGDRSITSITFAPGCNITSIGFSAFGDAAITEITLPASLTYIDEMAFWGCEKLQTINFLGTVEQWIAIGKGEDWCFDVPCSTIHCSDGTTPCVNVEDNEYYDDWD